MKTILSIIIYFIFLQSAFAVSKLRTSPVDLNSISIYGENKSSIFQANRDTPLYATFDGQVLKVRRDNKFIVVFIKNNKRFYSMYITTSSKIDVKKNDKIKEGQIIGYLNEGGLLLYSFYSKKFDTRFHYNKKSNELNYSFIEVDN